MIAGFSECKSGDIGRQAKTNLAHGKDGNLQGAVAIFNSVKSQGKPNPLIYNSLLEACIQCNDLHAAEHFQEAKNLGLADLLSYNARTA